MKIINYNNSLVEFKFIPRRYNYSTLSYTMIKESTKQEFTNTNADGSITLDSLGYLSFNLYTRDKEMTEGDTYNMKIYDANGIVYRCKIYCTDNSDLQEFNIVPINENVIDL